MPYPNKVSTAVLKTSWLTSSRKTCWKNGFISKPSSKWRAETPWTSRVYSTMRICLLSSNNRKFMRSLNLRSKWLISWRVTILRKIKLMIHEQFHCYPSINPSFPSWSKPSVLSCSCTLPGNGKSNPNSSSIRRSWRQGFIISWASSLLNRSAKCIRGGGMSSRRRWTLNKG